MQIFSVDWTAVLLHRLSRLYRRKQFAKIGRGAQSNYKTMHIFKPLFYFRTLVFGELVCPNSVWLCSAWLLSHKLTPNSIQNKWPSHIGFVCHSFIGGCFFILLRFSNVPSTIMHGSLPMQFVIWVVLASMDLMVTIDHNGTWSAMWMRGKLRWVF